MIFISSSLHRSILRFSINKNKNKNKNNCRYRCIISLLPSTTKKEIQQQRYNNCFGSVHYFLSLPIQQRQPQLSQVSTTSRTTTRFNSTNRNGSIKTIMEEQQTETSKKESETTMVGNGVTEKIDNDNKDTEKETKKDDATAAASKTSEGGVATTDTTATTNTTTTTETKRPRKKKNGRREWQQAKKKARTEKSKDQKKNVRKIDYDVDAREQPPQEGSFANEELRKQFGIELENSSLNIKIGDDQSTNKRKVALLLGFLGTKYWGFQANPRAHTIQAELELAMWRAGLIQDLNFGQPNKVGFSMSARTDKGVHACAQVCSLKIELLPEDLTNLDSVRQRIQERLPDDIHVLDVQRTTRNFCAKTQRERVRYSYILPSFLLHPDYKSIFESLNIPMSGRHDVGRHDVVNKPLKPLTKEEITKLRDILKDYRSTEEQRTRLKSALQKYEGTHPFHNFTRGIKPGQANANRYIEFFRMQDPIIVDGMEWIPTQVLGQSFLLHQIRKMISMAIDIGRGAALLDVMDKALDKTQFRRVNVAPAQGLFLEMSYFTGYNRRKQTNPDLPDLDWNQEGDANTRWSEFRDKIRKHIIEEENVEGNFIQYFYMQEYIFDYRRFYKLDGNGDDEIGDEDENNGDEDDGDNEVEDADASAAASASATSSDNKDS